jgi:hypothetical protein
LVQLGQALAFFGDERGEIHEKKTATGREAARSPYQQQTS